MADVFISYKREDRRVAERLSIALEQLGFNVWWDFELLSGDQFRRAIEKVIDECSAVIVLWSVLARDSTFVVDEATYARDQNKLCPARIDDCRLPLGFGGDHVIDLRNWEGEMQQDGLQLLLRSLEAKTGKKARLGARPRDADDEKRFAEMEAFKASQVGASETSLRAFLRDYPNGAFSNFVRGQLAEVTARAPQVAVAAPVVVAPPPPPPPPVEAVRPPPYEPPRAPSPEPPPSSGPPWPLIAGGAIALCVVLAVVAWRPWEGGATVEEPSVTSAEEAPAAYGPLEEAGEAIDQAAPRDFDAELEAARRDEREQGNARASEQADDSAYRIAQSTNTVAAYDAYLRNYPSGRNASAARSARQRLTSAASAGGPVSLSSAYDLAQLHADVRRAAESARAAESRAYVAARRGREAVASAEDAATRARAGESGYSVYVPTNDNLRRRYEGGWANGSYSGYGVLVVGAGDTAGERYSGQFDASGRRGFGVTSYASREILDRYEGARTNGQRSAGVIYWKDGGRFAGDFRASLPSSGVFYYSSGQRYEGEMRDNARAGVGILWDPQGRVIQAGNWENDNLVTPLTR